MVNDVVQAAVERAGLVEPGSDGGYSAHSLRAGFVTPRPRRLGPRDRAPGHRPLHTVGTYIRVETAWDDNATTLGL